MMSSMDAEYFRGRAARERVLARAAPQPNVAAIHEELARQYDALVDQAERRPTPDIAPPAQRYA